MRIAQVPFNICFCVLLCLATASRCYSQDQVPEFELSIRDLIREEKIDSARTAYKTHISTNPKMDSRNEAEALLIHSLILNAEDDYKSAMSESTRALEILNEEDPFLEFRIRTSLAESYRQDYNMDSMKVQLDLLLADQRYGDTLSIASVYFGMYQYYYRGEDKDVALDYIQKARDMMAGKGEMENAAMFDSYIGRLYQDLDNDSLSAFYQNRALEYLLANDHIDKASHVLLERGSYFNGKGEFERAEQDLLECIRLAEQTGNLSNIANANQFISSAYTEMGRYQEAEEAIDRSMVICDEYDIEICRVYAHMYYAHLYHESGDMEKAIFHAKKLSEYPIDQYSSEVWEGLGLLSKSYAGTGEFELAYQAKVSETLLADSLFNLEKEEAMGRLREQYEREKNVLEISELKNQAKIEDLKKKGLAVGLTLLSLLSVLIVYREVQKRKVTKRLHQVEIDLKETKEKRLREELDYRNRELSAKALNIAQKNELLQKLQSDLETMANERGAQECVREVVNTLRLENTIDGNWDQFTQQFTELNPDFYRNLTQASSAISKSDLRLAALLRMNLSSKEIGGMLNISDEGVKKARHRFRKKLELQSEQSLEAFVMAL